MGSKNLKAVVVKGEQSPFVFDPARFDQAVKKSFQELKENPHTSNTFSKLGSAAMVSMMNEAGAYPVKNYLEAHHPEAWKVSGEELRKNHDSRNIEDQVDES